MTVVKNAEVRNKARGLATFSQVSAANTAQTCMTDGARAYRVTQATVTTSGAVGADKATTITLNSALGAAYDCLVATVTVVNGGTMIVWLPTNPIDLMEGDSLDFLAAAMGAGITSAVVIYAEEL